jgi:hypothetical protein
VLRFGALATALSRERDGASGSTFIEYAKDLVDQLNAWHSEEASFSVDEFTRTTRSMHFDDSILGFEKGPGRKTARDEDGGSSPLGGLDQYSPNAARSARPRSSIVPSKGRKRHRSSSGPELPRAPFATSVR